MKRFFFWVVLALAATITPALALDKVPTTDDEIAQALIAQSINAYPGNCPCPYNLARNGSRCGGRSAHSRAGGAGPLCYRDDVTPEMIKRYRLQHK